jgi:hypothetical protein
MKKSLLIVAVLLFLCPQVYAIPMTQLFQVTIDSIIFPENEFSDPPPSIDYFHGPRVGDVFSGAATYDDAGIPESGDWKIGHVHDNVLYPDANEYQDFDLDWNGVMPGWGWMMDTANPPNYLTFADGRLSGIHSIYHADLFDGLEDEGFLDTEYISRGHFPYWEGGPETIAKWSGYNLTGTLNSVPEPSILVLIGTAILGLTGLKSRRKPL